MKVIQATDVMWLALPIMCPKSIKDHQACTGSKQHGKKIIIISRMGKEKKNCKNQEDSKLIVMFNKTRLKKKQL